MVNHTKTGKMKLKSSFHTKTAAAEAYSGSTPETISEQRLALKTK